MADITDSILRARKKRAKQAAETAPHLTTAGGADAGDAAIAMIELLFFAYRDFTSDPDAILETYGFGRAHHRVLHFVNRSPGLRVADLLDILKIRKQSLARVLKQLVAEGFIERHPGPEDQRERLLYTTERGRSLALTLLQTQIARVSGALGTSAADHIEQLQDFLMRMVAEGERAKVADLIARGHKAARNQTEPVAPPAKERP